MKHPLTGRSIHELNRDYLEALRVADELDLDADLVDGARAYQRFVERHGHRVAPYPQALLPVAHSEAMDNRVRKHALEMEAKTGGPRRPWFRLLNAPASDPNPALVRVFAGYTRGVESACFSPDGRFCLSGSWDGTLRLWEVQTGRGLRRFEGHTRGINSPLSSLKCNP